MKNRLPPFLLHGLMAAVLALAAGSGVHAQGDAALARINVTPLRLELPAGDTATQMVIRNQADTPISVQLRAFAWTQQDGEDRYTPTRDVAVSPSIVTIAPGRAQSFHVLSRLVTAAPGERRYRVVIDELPSDRATAPGTARTRLRLTLPLFVNRDSAPEPRLRFAVTPQALVIANEGGQTARVGDMRLSRGGETVPLGPGAQMRYVHGQSWVALPLPPGIGCSGAALRLQGVAEQDQFDEMPGQDCP